MSGNWITKTRKYALLDRDDCTCQYCGSKVIKGAQIVAGFSPKEVATLDHLIPRSKGGDNSNENLVTACMSCNASRKDMPLESFVADVALIISQAQKPCAVQFRKKVAA